MPPGSPARKALVWPLLTLSALMAGCLGIGKPTPPARLYVLTAMPPSSAAAAAASGANMASLRLRVIGVPRYLDRPQIVTGSEGGLLVLAEFDRWAEPILDGLERVMTADLTARLPQLSVTRANARPELSEIRELLVEVLTLDGAPGKSARLEAEWSLWTGDQRGAGGRWAHDEPVPEADYAALTAAWSRALGRLSDEIARALEASSALSGPGSS